MASETAVASSAPKGRANTKKAPAAEKKHPPTISLITEALKVLNDKSGSSLQAIKKYMTDVHKVDVEKTGQYIRKALKKAVEDGKLIQTKGSGAAGSFKLPSKGPAKKTTKKPATSDADIEMTQPKTKEVPAKKAKAPAAKKPAAKKRPLEPKNVIEEVQEAPKVKAAKKPAPEPVKEKEPEVEVPVVASPPKVTKKAAPAPAAAKKSGKKAKVVLPRKLTPAKSPALSSPKKALPPPAPVQIQVAAVKPMENVEEVVKSPAKPAPAKKGAKDTAKAKPAAKPKKAAAPKKK